MERRIEKGTEKIREKEKERVSWKEKKELVKETPKEKEKGERENGIERDIEIGKGTSEQNIISGTTGVTSDEATKEKRIEKDIEKEEKEEDEKGKEKVMEMGTGKGAERELITEQKLNQKDLNKDMNEDKNMNMVKKVKHDKNENRPEEKITLEAVSSVIHGHGKKLISSTSKNVELHRIDYSQREETKIEDDISHEINEYYRHKILNGSELTVQNNKGTSDHLDGEIITLNRKNLHVVARDSNDKEENKDRSIKKEKKEKEMEKGKEIDKEKEREREREREVGCSTSLPVPSSLSVARMLPSLLKGSLRSRSKSSSAQVCRVV